MARKDKIPILLVDDRTENLIALEALLEDQELDFVRATSGNEALLLSLKHDFALVLMDVQMPEMDGFETGELMRAHPKTRHLPIIFITASLKDEAHQFKGYEAGAVDYLLKPVDPAVLRNKVRIFSELFRNRCELEMHRHALEALVEERTARLKAANEQLERELNDRKRAEESLRQRDAFIRNILESVDEGFIVIDRDYRILSANRAYCESAGLQGAQAAGRTCYGVSHHLDRPCFESQEQCPVRQTFETGAPQFATHVHTDERGGRWYVEIKSYPVVNEAGQVTSAIETITDITERKKLEDQLRQAQKMEAIGTLAGGVAHDFNNILSAVVGYGSILQLKMRSDDPLRLYSEQILAAAERAAGLTQSLLAFSRKQVINPRNIDLNASVRQVDKFLSRIIGEDITLTLTLCSEPLTIFADTVQVEQILMNLASNARDAMPAGGSLLITTERIDVPSLPVTPLQAGAYALLSVTDSGTGMDEQTQAKIFEPFFTTKDVGRGTGLGLAIVYGVVKQNNGHVNVYSEVGKGTSFKIYLPLAAENAEPGQGPKDHEPLRGGKETILLAEDDKAIRDLTRNILTEFGYRVIEAEDGEAALAKFEADCRDIQLVITDIIMPKKSGRELFEAVRKKKPEVGVIFTSGYPLDMIRKEGVLDQDISFLSKPSSPQTLLLRVREVLDRGNVLTIKGRDK